MQSNKQEAEAENFCSRCTKVPLSSDMEIMYCMLNKNLSTELNRSLSVIQHYLLPVTPVDARTWIQAMACIMRKSVNSQTVSIVLPSIRPSAPPISANRANNVYASIVSMYVYFSSEKYIFTTTVNTKFIQLTKLLACNVLAGASEIAGLDNDRPNEMQGWTLQDHTKRTKWQGWTSWTVSGPTSRDVEHSPDRTAYCYRVPRHFRQKTENLFVQEQ